MTRIAITRDMPVPHDQVWEAIADLGSYTAWMRDAESITFADGQQRGEGTCMEVRTVVGPFRTNDVIEVTGWEEGRSIEVAHGGLITGRGALTAEPTEKGTLVSWREELVFPWWLGGGVAAWLARPVLAAIWRGNLARLEQSLTMRGDDPPQTPRRPTVG